MLSLLLVVALSFQLVSADTYIIANDQYVAKIGSGEDTYYFHNDLTGSPIAITDESGNVVRRAEFFPFGLESPSVSSLPNIVKFQGQVFDQIVGLYRPDKDNFQTYDPETGRYLVAGSLRSPSLVDPQGLNLYSYRKNNPYNNLVKNQVLAFFDIPSVAPSIINPRDVFSRPPRSPEMIDESKPIALPDSSPATSSGESSDSSSDTEIVSITIPGVSIDLGISVSIGTPVSIGTQSDPNPTVTCPKCPDDGSYGGGKNSEVIEDASDAPTVDERSSDDIDTSYIEPPKQGPPENFKHSRRDRSSSTSQSTDSKKKQKVYHSTNAPLRK